MTVSEAKIVLGLREDDVPTEKGLLMVIESSEALIRQTVSKRSASTARREIKAAKKLLQSLRDDKALKESLGK